MTPDNPVIPFPLTQPAVTKDPDAATQVETSKRKEVEPIGSGVDIPKLKRPRLPKSVKRTDPAVVSPPPVEWIDRPSLKEKSYEPENMKSVGVRVDVFDLAVKEQLDAYNAILERAAADDSNIAIHEERKEFSEVTQNWKVFVKTQRFMFRKLI